MTRLKVSLYYNTICCYRVIWWHTYKSSKRHSTDLQDPLWHAHV